MGPLSLTLLIVAVVCAFLRARHDQEARLQRTAETEDGERRLIARGAEVRYTAEGEAHLRKARTFRLLFFAFGLGAVMAAWMGW